jgi:hypothetical protein
MGRLKLPSNKALPITDSIHLRWQSYAYKAEYATGICRGNILAQHSLLYKSLASLPYSPMAPLIPRRHPIIARQLLRAIILVCKPLLLTDIIFALETDFNGVFV